MSRSPRQRQIEAISAALGDRKLAWFGIRGHDAAALLPIPQFTESYAVTAPLRASKLSVSVTLEDLTGERVDLDAYDIDFDDRPEVTDLRRTMLARLRQPSAISTYRPSHFLDAITFATRDTLEYLGLFKGRQSAFEHKPWVETQLTDLGIRTIPWKYVADEYRESIEDQVARRPMILRASSRSGGVGIALVEHPGDIAAKWPIEGEQFIAVAPFLGDAIPINVGACVFDRDTVTVHAGSVQLVGIPDLTTRRFGYCGNDFAAFAEIDRKLIRTMDRTTVETGKWMAERGFIGAFGVDYLIDDTGVYFAEINARLQGSTSLGSALAADTQHVDIVLDHVAAHLGLPPQEDVRMTDWIDELPPAAHLVAHNTRSSRATMLGAAPRPGPETGTRLELIPEGDVGVDPGAILFRAVFDHGITKTGFDLSVAAADLVRTALDAWEAPK